jgi:hypothetical protein
VLLQFGSGVRSGTPGTGGGGTIGANTANTALEGSDKNRLLQLLQSLAGAGEGRTGTPGVGGVEPGGWGKMDPGLATALGLTEKALAALAAFGISPALGPLGMGLSIMGLANALAPGFSPNPLAGVPSEAQIAPLRDVNPSQAAARQAERDAAIQGLMESGFFGAGEEASSGLGGGFGGEGSGLGGSDMGSSAAIAGSVEAGYIICPASNDVARSAADTGGRGVSKNLMADPRILTYLCPRHVSEQWASTAPLFRQALRQCERCARNSPLKPATSKPRVGFTHRVSPSWPTTTTGGRRTVFTFQASPQDLAEFYGPSGEASRKLLLARRTLLGLVHEGHRWGPPLRPLRITRSI